MHIHLDAIGGISGNMFVGAILDAAPELYELLPQVLIQAGFADLVELAFNSKNDGVFAGSLFDVRPTQTESHGHHHRHFSEIREIITQSQLADPLKGHALGIFTALAQAEADIHGKPIEHIAFHEVGAWDSIADVVCAAFLIDALDQRSPNECSWSVSSLPMGNGTIASAHGTLPLPAPAVSLLLKNFPLHDDGLHGERITPTGAAILKYLQPKLIERPTGLILEHTGFGFGHREFPGLSNVLRILCFSRTGAQLPWQTDTVLEITFEVDDQTPEDLSLGLEKLRAQTGVIDVIQTTGFGKKGRTNFSIRVLAEPPHEQTVIAGCFDQTTTIGVRKQLLERATLKREEFTRQIKDRTLSIKQVERPAGISTKVASDDLAAADNQNQRSQLRRAAESSDE